MAGEELDCVSSKQASDGREGQLGGTMLTLDNNCDTARRKDHGENMNSNFAVGKDIELVSGSREEFLRGEPFVDLYSCRELSHSNGIGVHGPSFCTPIKVPINGLGLEFIKLAKSTRMGPRGAGLSKTKCYAQVGGPWVS